MCRKGMIAFRNSFEIPDHLPELPVTDHIQVFASPQNTVQIQCPESRHFQASLFQLLWG